MLRAALTGLGYAIALLIVAALTLLLVLVLAGPHAGLLPQPLEIAVVVLGWLGVLIVPAWFARWLWKRLGKTPAAPGSGDGQSP